ncbi:MAG: hypothetical protein ACLQG3_16470 [Terracidiphilus sp.]
MGQKGEKKKERKRAVRSEEPNAETLAAIAEGEAGKVRRAATVEELMMKLNAED